MTRDFLRTGCLVALLAMSGCSTMHYLGFGNSNQDDSSDDTPVKPEEKAKADAKADAKLAKQEAKEKEKLESKSIPICPQVAIVRSLDTVRDYGHETPAADQLVSAGKMRKITGDCAYQPTGIDIAFELRLTGGRGPRLGGNKIEFPYFIAVVDPTGNVLNKDRMVASFKFSGDDKLADITQDLHVFIPLPLEKREDGPSYQVLTGFQLTPEQLEIIQADKK